MISMLPPVPAENAKACHKGSSNKLGNIPIEAATNGTLSIIAERNPNNIISTSVFGNISVRSPAKLNSIPRDSRAPTAIKIPRKNKILGNSIFESDR